MLLFYDIYQYIFNNTQQVILIILCAFERERAGKRETVRIERCGEKTSATLQSPSPHTHYLFVPFLFCSRASFVITLWFLFLLLSLLYNIFFFLHIVGLQPLNASHSSFELKKTKKPKRKSSQGPSLIKHIQEKSKPSLSAFDTCLNLVFTALRSHSYITETRMLQYISIMISFSWHSLAAIVC